jgi:AraC family transcriptional regulator
MTLCWDWATRSSKRTLISSLCRFAIFPIANIGRTGGKCRCIAYGLVKSISMIWSVIPWLFSTNRITTYFFYLPADALQAIADDVNAPRISDLNRGSAPTNDATISNLGQAVLPALSRPDQASQLFVDYILFALGIHVAQTYGGMRPLPPLVRGGLAPWQERRAKEILSANLDGRVMLKEVAQECGLSTSHFSRAFHRTVGAAPHHWLLTHRIKVAKQKLRDRRLPLAEVALTCGFADQSHLTRVFTRFVGVSPGAWRRACAD